jgi:hypothetical protein
MRVVTCTGGREQKLVGWAAQMPFLKFTCVAVLHMVVSARFCCP